MDNILGSPTQSLSQAKAKLSSQAITCSHKQASLIISINLISYITS